MSDTWTREQITIALGCLESSGAEYLPRGYLTLNAERYGALAIHRNVAGNDFRAGGWSVTHIPTGRCLVGTRSKALARQFVEEVAPLTDWSKVKAGKCPRRIKPAVVAASRRAMELEYLDMPMAGALAAAGPGSEGVG